MGENGGIYNFSKHTNALRQCKFIIYPLYVLPQDWSVPLMSDGMTDQFIGAFLNCCRSCKSFLQCSKTCSIEENEM